MEGEEVCGCEGFERRMGEGKIGGDCGWSGRAMECEGRRMRRNGVKDGWLDDDTHAWKLTWDLSSGVAFFCFCERERDE